MTRIILVRHGETPWNKDKIFRGTVDIPLNDTGREEAELAGEWLQKETIHAAYSSPLSRARDTAAAICRHHKLQVQDLPGLGDINYGEWQSLPLTEVKKVYADLYRQWETAPHTVRFPRGETLEEVEQRAWAAVEEVVKRHPGRTVLLAAHRAVNKVLIARFIGLDNSHFWRIGQDTTAINRFHLVGDVWHIMSVNDNCHLRSLKRGAYVDF
ncbi:MAG: histidine phosphatase family protein [Deltaproteobacteria bacterium]|nr:MAG: histidine phosphatase family protein [Deltaproteobacteria bacterium]